jgi:hypothetical protein
LKIKPDGQQMICGVLAFWSECAFPTIKLKKQHEILNNPDLMPLVSLEAD